ncbi:helix-turn-helix domain-containing protein [Streptomyces sp. NPDC096205]|uniref:helix-turn-helix domain-containing protein n=1 Tax=Streptomyces sp. NPDC096205 TaxID=3366081 RepID=UPI003816D1E7
MSSYRLRSVRLHEAAAARGDHSNYAIAKRTGLNQTTLSRISRGLAKPAISTLLVLASAYELSVDELIERDDGAGSSHPTPSEETALTTSAN